MEIENFIQKFAEQFDETSLDQFNRNTTFKQLDEWSSMLALGIIAMVDEEYSILLTGDDIRNSSTIEDLYNILSQKLS